MPPGVVTVYVGEAHNLKETEFFGTQDPYAVLTIGNRKQKTKVHTDGGKHAVWNQTFEWTISAESYLTLEVFNKNSLSKDDLIGGARYGFERVFSQQQESCWISILRGDNKQSGQVHISITFRPLPTTGYGASAPVFGAPADIWPAGGVPLVGQGDYPLPAYPPSEATGMYPPPAAGAFAPQGIPTGYNPPPPSGYPPPGAAVGAPPGHHAYAPPPAGYPVPPSSSQSQQQSGSSGMNAVYAGLAGAALGAGATGAYMYAQQGHGHGHGHNKHGKHKHKGYKHKGHKHKGYKHKGHKHKGYKHKGLGKKWKKK